MNLLIYLHSEIRAFAMTPAQVADIQKRYPDWTITHVTDRESFLEALPAAEMCILWYMKAEWYSLTKRLRYVFTPAAGRDWVEEDPAGRVEVHHGHFHGQLMSESLLSMMLFFNRKMDQSLAYQKKRKWERDYLSSTVPLSEQHIVMIGYGAIGRYCARLIKGGFGSLITGVRRSPREPEQDRDADSIVSWDALNVILPYTDHLVFILPGGPETQGIFTREHFKMLKPGAYLYNIGRGNCYQENDLLWAIEEGLVAGAGLDVFDPEPLPTESPLWQNPRVFLTAHASAVNSHYVGLFLEEFYTSIEGL